MKQNFVENIALGGHVFTLRLNCPESCAFFAPYASDGVPEWDLGLTPGELCAAQEKFSAAVPCYAECGELANRISSALLEKSACVFHGVSFLWRGKAWIFTAPPGTGKTTQLTLWAKNFGAEIRVMNGDKPVLAARDGGFFVYPSPWRGKENLGSDLCAPLGGMILLRQAPRNVIRRLEPRSAVLMLLHQFLMDEQNDESTLLACGFLSELLRAVPMWQLDNLGDDASAILTHDTLTRFEEEKS